mgnify:FL=1
MKTKFFIAIVFLFACHLFAYCQPPEHLNFKGVPIDGTLAEYVYKMKLNGFRILKSEDGIAMLTGDFAGYKECIIAVATLKQKDLVYKIAVIFPNRETWSTLSGNYFDLKKMLIEKYGRPSEETETFDSFTQPHDDGRRMYEVKFDNCKYSSIWNIDKGEIQLSIDHDNMINCFVTLIYFDRINNAIIKEKAKADL